MSPIIVVVGFVVLLALLLYYMYKEKVEWEEAQGQPGVEPTTVRVRDYEAQPTVEEPAKAQEAEQPKTPEPEPSEQAPEAPQTDKAETLSDDLESLSGVGDKYRALLKAAGIRSVAALAGEEPNKLLQMLREANEREGLVKRLPRVREVEAWVQKAKEQSP